MTHELRTPLNSTLILAKLLADNKDGNLTAEQVRVRARRSRSAGNDLLTLINDILDLSKIEAGKVEVHVRARSTLGRAASTACCRTFEPLARRRRAWRSAIDDRPRTRRRASRPTRSGSAQILKNLLVERAQVHRARRGRAAASSAPATTAIAFAVRDTGIGIPADQQELIFEAFRQADGSTHRKYGGTGLGLSISRDLARLLGGDIALQSAPGEGSVFTLTLPRVYAARRAAAPSPAATQRRPPRAAAPRAAASAASGRGAAPTGPRRGAARTPARAGRAAPARRRRPRPARAAARA